jgi:hypothetical protein
LRLDEDALVIIAMAVVATAELSGTSKILVRWVSSINAARGGVAKVSRSMTWSLFGFVSADAHQP